METPKVNVADVAADQHSQERPEGRDLPIELWLTIAQSLRLDVDQHFPSYPVRLFDMRALKNLRLVSQTMKDVIEPLYWERVELSANTRPREAMEAVKHLKANPVHRGYVKYMVLKRWRAEHLVHRWGDDRENEPTSETLSGLFTSMRNLRAIHFEWMYLTPEMFAHLYALPHLQCVVFLHLPTIPPSVSLDCGTLPMSTFTLDRVLSSHITDSSDSLGIATCVNLFVNPAKLETLQISFRVAPVLYRFAEEVTFDSLREFEGPEPSALHEIDLVYKFMRSCPNLECINITPRITDGVPGLDSIPSPPDDVLGQLQSFQGTLPLAARIVPSRPVEKVYASCRSGNAHTHAFGPALQRLATSSKSIRVLHLKLVGLNDEHLYLVASNLPLLEELEIGLTGHILTREWNETACGPTSAAFPAPVVHAEEYRMGPQRSARDSRALADDGRRSKSVGVDEDSD
ncbi:hypothetical protein FRC04_011876 [Tulasnella sp. 424]|nr:hypothetical protein FRC04_011876 [Tulasnella sp. 424]